jgi:hypothetical protein
VIIVLVTILTLTIAGEDAAVLVVADLVVQAALVADLVLLLIPAKAADLVVQAALVAVVVAVAVSDVLIVVIVPEEIRLSHSLASPSPSFCFIL